MAVNLSPVGNAQQFFDNTGLPLNGGLIYTYQAGSSTALATYTDVNGTVANSNPIVLDSSGRLPNEVWLTYGFNYKFVVQTSTGTTIGTYDNLYGIIGVAGTSTGTTIPTGMISLWYGSIGSVPVGWYLCDGTNGTPDLRDRFIVGAGSTYSVAATGGAKDAILVSHTHTINDAGHTHLIQATNNGVVGGSNNLGPGSGPNVVSSSATTTVTTGISLNSAGTSGTNANLPPYYALAYVMKS
jgi:microcystin-dependent protein